MSTLVRSPASHGIFDPTSLGTSAASALRDIVSRAMANYGAALCRMPHVEPDAFRHPPPEGWEGVDVDTLKARGKSDDGIEFVRHLPYLAHGTYMTMNIKSIDIGQGETWPAYAEEFIETPGYVIWIGQQDTREGHFLLLDTLHGRSVASTCIVLIKQSPLSDWT